LAFKKARWIVYGSIASFGMSDDGYGLVAIAGRRARAQRGETGQHELARWYGHINA